MDAAALARPGRDTRPPARTDWVLIGSVYSTDSHQGSLDEHLKKYLKRATAGWVAAVLEKAAVITIDRSRPAQIKLRSGW